MNDFHIVVIGAGAVGLSIAESLSRGKEGIVLIERNTSVGQETSSRNSEVIHSGIYYKDGSSKALHCVRGKELLYKYCRNKEIPFKKIGKLIVANMDSRNDLLKLYQQGKRNGLMDLVLLEKNEIKKIEPEVRANYAIFSPSTGILDSHEFMHSLLNDFERNGGSSLFKTNFIKAEFEESKFIIKIENPDNSTFSFTADNVVIAAGLNSSEVTKRVSGIEKNKIPTIQPVKGNYFSYAGKSPFSHLIYPLPDKQGLGIHSTLDLAGNLRFGPDVDLSDVTLEVHDNLQDKFLCAIKKYWPQVEQEKLMPDYAGLRPKIVVNKEMRTDFQIDVYDKQKTKLICLHGIESPGLTSSLSLGEYISKLMP